MKRALFLLMLAVSAAPCFAAKKDEAKKDEAAAQDKGAAQGGPMQMAGMSIVGNDESPKELVIVPWKSSQLGDAPGISRLLDDSTQPVDKDVFTRELQYYEIRAAADGGGK